MYNCIVGCVCLIFVGGVEYEIKQKGYKLVNCNNPHPFILTYNSRNTGFGSRTESNGCFTGY